MSKKSIREEARERNVSKGKVWTEREAKKAIEKAGENFYLVYAWRWSNDERYAKIGKSSIASLDNTYRRMPKTYHPTDDPLLIGYLRCANEQQAFSLEKELLNDVLTRVRPDREWVEIDETLKDVFCRSGQ